MLICFVYIVAIHIIGNFNCGNNDHDRYPHNLILKI